MFLHLRKSFISFMATVMDHVQTFYDNLNMFKLRQYVNGKVGLEHTVESYGLCSCFVYLIC